MAITAYDIQVQPALHLFTVTLPEPDMHQPISDKRRMQQALMEAHDLPLMDCEMSQLRLLQPALAKSNRTITVAVYQFEQSDFSPQIEAHSVAEFLEQQSSRFAHLASQRQLALRVDCDPDLLGYFDQHLLAVVIKCWSK